MIPTTPTPPTGPPRRGISRKEAVGLAVHRGLDRWLSPLGVWVMRRTKGGVTKAWKVDALVLTTHGRRSGRARSVVLQFFRDGEMMLLAAANDGGAALPGWYWNLTAAPTARVEVGGATIAVRAEILEASAATDAWTRILERDPSYERYARAAGRPIPIVRLVPIDPGIAGGERA
jgi:deazaflavin-dependent oxidoreductase (nitroreductase family)